jgi:DNA-binding LacI/PurR family transcriptional regulator
VLCADERDLTAPELGYPVVHELIRSHLPFTAIVSFNDIAAVGAIRALRDANLKVPEDVSVLGFGDISVAAYHTPRLTPIRQPLRDMGETAGRGSSNRSVLVRSIMSVVSVLPGTD